MELCSVPVKDSNSGVPVNTQKGYWVDEYYDKQIVEEFDLLDIQEQADEVGYLTPREYAKLRGMAPQLIYYYIRNKVVEVELCKCGRKVIHVKTVDRVLEERRRKP